MEPKYNTTITWYIEDIASDEGFELEDIEKTLKKRIRLQTGNDNSGGLKEIGLFRYRKSGEAHGYSPTVFKKIQYLGTNGKKPYTKINDEKHCKF